MSLTDGSYNDVCDYYQPGKITVSLNNKLKGTDYFGPGQIRIGETMEVEFDLHLKSYCNSNGINDCVIFRIGEETYEKYPLIQLGTQHTINVTVTTINGLVTKTSPIDTIYIGEFTRIKLTWSQTRITLIYDGNTVIDEAVDSHKIDTTPYLNDDISLPGVFRLRPYAGDVNNYCVDLFSCLDANHSEVFQKYCDSNNHLRYVTWALDTCPLDPTSTEAVNAVVASSIFVGPDNGPHECCIMETPDAEIKNLCIKTSHIPHWNKDYYTMCHIKQNFIAETMSTVKGNDREDQAPDLQGQIMNVRAGYLEFDGNGATVITGLNDSINYWPVTAAEFLVEFRKIQYRECGIGTNDETDLCDGLDAAFAQFEIDNSAVDSFTPERERKLIIVSNNKQLTCKNGNNICDEYEDKIYGRDKGENNFGVSVVMVNIDMNGEIDTYLPCLTMYGGNRILDVDTFGNLDFQNTNTKLTGRDAVIDHVQDRICAKAITPSPTIDPTVIPTQTPTKIPTKTPTKTPTNPPSKIPTQSPTNPPSNYPTKTPSKIPTITPTESPTNPPSNIPTESPTD
eukprot:470942_1